ncbi:phytanoyl-CoA dioxygenase family protein [Candidatus Pseudothioglobus singularis]|jgi:ectoine hydroxylase-related dioxygenase (phytanoyl-CoA dioxygenase family)|uniref:Phytanoyl-CoA dioxygenase n=1 Tax=Candidatus Pseudothioglobus singularis PS1 TaxID=1125411 RepID=A0A0M4LF50_9GAMM|nr:phytanoyl-CoA dioxygenase family protein [Candidatus Pseudothioglobus singularis]ALE02769.1 hypothetical protein W908_07010 [Candidatus Pseudothioglobus singularis PS1]
MNSIKSYTNLNKIVVFFHDWLNLNQQGFSSQQLELLKKDNALIILSLFWLGKKIEEVNNFQANRYFLNAINVEYLQEQNSLYKFSIGNELDNQIGGNSSNNLDFLKDLGVVILREFDEQKNINSDTREKWNLSKRNFFNDNGYVVIPDVLSSAECDHYREIVINIAKEEELNNSGYFYGFNNRFQRIYNLVNKSHKLGELLTLPIVEYIMNDLFDRETLHDKYTLSSWHANIIPGGGEEQKFHLDSAVPQPIPPWIIRANINFIVEDYTADNGATVCLPGSHKILSKPTFSDEQKHKKQLVKMIAPKGSMVIWTGHLWHKSGENSTNKNRVALLACFAASHLIEMALEENHQLIIGEENLNSFSEELKNLLLFNHGLKQGAKSKSSYFKD